MPQSLSRVLVHAVFSTHERKPLIDATLRPELHAYVAGTLKENGCPAIRVGGVDDHVHALFGLSRTKTIADAVELMKTSSTKWIKATWSDKRNFGWQNGYGAFSVGMDEVDRVAGYIARQEDHHHKESFQDEFRLLCKRYHVDLNELYAWD